LSKPPNRPPLAQSSVSSEELADLLDRHTVVGKLWQPEADRVRCVACGHRCLLASGRRGICKVRFNARGELKVPFGYVAGVQSDPAEKKPYLHVYPGSDALTFGMMGAGQCRPVPFGRHAPCEPRGPIELGA